MTKPKNEGVIGFKDFVNYSLALLAKTAWRVFQNSDDLWVRIIKGIYFLDKQFLDAKKGSHAFWCWSSLLDGRYFLKPNLCWQIGDRLTGRIWKDNQIPSLPNHHLVTEDKELSKFDIVVATLIDNRQWRLAGVSLLLDDIALHAIQQIPLSTCVSNDNLFWSPANSGIYSVKHSYAKAMEDKSNGKYVASTSTTITQATQKKARNDKLFTQVEPNPSWVIESAQRAVKEYWQSCVLVCDDVLETGRTTLPRHWISPPKGSIKVNCDGDSMAKRNEVAISIVCKDELGLVSCILKRQPTLGNWRCKGILEDNVDLLATKAGFSLAFAPDEGNAVADFIVALALKEVILIGWVSSSSPSCLSYQLRMWWPTLCLQMLSHLSL